MEQELLTIPEHLSSPQFLVGFMLPRVTLVLWPLCYLSFFDLLILITPLVSSNSSSSTALHIQLKKRPTTKTTITLHLVVSYGSSLVNQVSIIDMLFFRYPYLSLDWTQNKNKNMRRFIDIFI